MGGGMFLSYILAIPIQNSIGIVTFSTVPKTFEFIGWAEMSTMLVPESVIPPCPAPRKWKWALKQPGIFLQLFWCKAEDGHLIDTIGTHVPVKLYRWIVPVEATPF